MLERIRLLYTVYTNGFYGTERMSLATAWGLRDEFEPIIVAPPGPAVGEARRMGFEVVETASALAIGGMQTLNYGNFGAVLKPYLSQNKRLVIVSTHIGHSLSFAAMNLLYRRQTAQIHVVHGPPDVGPGTRYVLNRLPVTTVAISEFTRERLLASGVRNERIRVIENFLSAERVGAAPRRRPFSQSGVRRVAVISRLAPVKRLDVLLTCLENRPDLRSIAFHIYGAGVEHDAYADTLKARAKQHALNVVFEGFRLDVAEQLAQSDLFLHLCPSEPFGLVILEAMAAGTPVVVPNRGGAALVIADGVSGLHFVANDPESLGAVLADLNRAKPEYLNMLVSGGRAALASRFSEHDRLADYRSLIRASFAEGLGEERTDFNSLSTRRKKAERK